MKILDVIEYEGDNSTFVWKHPAEDFNTMSRLIVHESQEALFFAGGQALDLFKPGRHTLHTQNIPLLRKLINLPFDGVSPFHCEVYFINKTEQMAINWGMGNVNYPDPQHGDYVFTIGASGEMSLRVDDSRKLITKLVGTTNSLDQETLTRYFKAPLTMHIKTLLPKVLRESGASIFDVENDLTGISALLKERVSEEMADYGVCLEKLWINTIVKPESDPTYQLLNRQRGERVTVGAQGEIDKQRAAYEAQIGVIRHGGEVEQRRMDIDAQAYEQQQLGYSYQQRRGFDVMEKVAQNEGSGSDLRNAAMGLGIGFGAGGTFGQAMADIASVTGFSGLASGGTVPPAQSPTMPAAPQAPSGIPNMISLKEETTETPPVPGASAVSSDTQNGLADFQARVKKLEMLRGMIPEEEFNKRLKQLMDEI